MEKEKVLTERREKKERVRKEECEKNKETSWFLCKKREIKTTFFYDILMILLMHKEAYFNTNEFDPYIPSICVSLLQDCEDIFPNKIITSGLPPINGTKHLKFQAKLNRKHTKWVKFIERFSYMRKYKQDKKNIVIDVLS